MKVLRQTKKPCRRMRSLSQSTNSSRIRMLTWTIRWASFKSTTKKFKTRRWCRRKPKTSRNTKRWSESSLTFARSTRTSLWSRIIDKFQALTNPESWPLRSNLKKIPLVKPKITKSSNPSSERSTKFWITNVSTTSSFWSNPDSFQRSRRFWRRCRPSIKASSARPWNASN